MDRRTFLKKSSRVVQGGLAIGTGFSTLLRSQLARAVQRTDIHRMAYVLGNNSYDHLSTLRNANNDARLVATALEQAGFDLHSKGVRLNLSNNAMYRELNNFSRVLRPDSIALFYYAGHGFQQHGRNFLAGTDTQGSPALAGSRRGIQSGSGELRDTHLPFELGMLFQLIDHCPSDLNIVILDACRNNPFPNSPLADHGLAKYDAPSRTLISYSTQPGNIALDGNGDNSPYTKALVDAMSKRDATVLDLFNTTGLEVEASTQGRQVPWISLSPIPAQLAFSDLLTSHKPEPVGHVCASDTNKIRSPIDQLFKAWQTLNIRLYEAQWTEDAFQVAGKIQRNRGGIFKNRRRFFPRLNRVQVVSTNPVLQYLKGNTALFRNTYTMVFHTRRGRVIREKDIVESYTVVCGDDGLWRIKENYDYLEQS